jgi:hypothetical protein
MFEVETRDVDGQPTGIGSAGLFTARIDGLARDAVHDALWKHRALVKLGAMRGTLHLLPSAELACGSPPSVRRRSTGTPGIRS